MSLETAQQSIELMLAESPNEKRFSVVFFGGEPLSNLKLIRAVVDYCEARFAQLGKQVDFVMTTNHCTLYYLGRVDSNRHVPLPMTWLG